MADLHGNVLRERRSGHTQPSAEHLSYLCFGLEGEQKGNESLGFCRCVFGVTAGTCCGKQSSIPPPGTQPGLGPPAPLLPGPSRAAPGQGITNFQVFSETSGATAGLEAEVSPMGAPAPHQHLTHGFSKASPLFFNFDVKTFIFTNKSVTAVCCAPFPCMEQAASELFH